MTIFQTKIKTTILCLSAFVTGAFWAEARAAVVLELDAAALPVGEISETNNAICKSRHCLHEPRHAG